MADRTAAHVHVNAEHAGEKIGIDDLIVAAVLVVAVGPFVG
jgi:hypothetical protein